VLGKKGSSDATKGGEVRKLGKGKDEKGFKAEKKGVRPSLILLCLKVGLGG